MDANFRLKNQLISNYSVDPGLGIGWAYMVARSAYENYVLTQADEKDVSTTHPLASLYLNLPRLVRTSGSKRLRKQRLETPGVSDIRA